MNDEILSTNLSGGRTALALGVAVIADILQLPMNLAMFAGAMTGIGLITADVPLEGLDVAIDVVTAFVTSSLIGFHWTLLPTFVLEMVPGMDAAPTWTGCVAFVAWRRKKQQSLLRP